MLQVGEPGHGGISTAITPRSQRRELHATEERGHRNTPTGEHRGEVCPEWKAVRSSCPKIETTSQEQHPLSTMQDGLPELGIRRRRHQEHDLAAGLADLKTSTNPQFHPIAIRRIDEDAICCHSRPSPLSAIVQ